MYTKMENKNKSVYSNVLAHRKKIKAVGIPLIVDLKTNNNTNLNIWNTYMGKCQ